MTAAATRILGEIGQPSEAERVEFRRALVGRVPLSDDLTHDDFTALAASSSRSLENYG